MKAGRRSVRHSATRRGGRFGRRRDVVLVAAAVLLAALVLGHQSVPNVRGLGELLDSVVPWLGVGVPLLGLLALLARSRAGGVALLVPLLAWLSSFGAWFVPATPAAEAGGKPGDQLRFATQNLYAGNADPAGTARKLAETGADVIGVEEMTGPDRRAVHPVLNGDRPNHATEGTVGLWSRYPITRTEPVDLGLSWTRGLRAQVASPQGEVVVYVVHMPSLRPGHTEQRDRGLARLSAALQREPAQRTVALGDFNTASTDRQMTRFAPGYGKAQDAAGSGPGFTWPASWPMARLDHVLVRGLRAVDSDTVHTPGTDHRAAVATLRP